MSKEKLLASAQKNLEKGQIGKAIKDYQKILETDPKDIRNRQKLAELLSRERMKDEALKEFETVARTYADSGFYLKAIAVYRQMQKLDQARPDIYLRLAELNEKQGLTGDALAEYRNLSACYEKNRMFSEQLKTLQKIRELEPENLNVRVKIVENSLLVDSAENARKELQSLLDDLADDSARALKLYDHFLPKFPDDLLLRAGHAEALIRNGEKSQGMQMLHELLRSDPENAGLLRIMANVHRVEANYLDERCIYERLLAHQPADLEIREGYLRATIDAGDANAARKSLDKWQEDFAAAGRSGLVQEFASRLGGSAPKFPPAAPRLPAAADSESFEELPSAGLLAEGLEAPEPQEPEEPAELLEDLEEIAEAELLDDAEPVEEETLLADDDADEVSLDFLEEAPLDFLEAAGLPAETDSKVPAAVELELELDMELELELDTEPVPGTIPPAAEEEAAPLELQEDQLQTPEWSVDLADMSADMEVSAAAADFIDLGAEIAEEIPALPHGKKIESTAAVNPPKKRVRTDVEVDDPESHYNLGIAYKEMGLFDDAIGEFDKAMRTPERGVACLILKGMCLLEKGERKKAEETLRTGLARTDFAEDGRISLYYELGDIYEGGGELKEALECFQYVADRDLFYRNAGDRVAALRQRLGVEDGAVGTAGAGRKNRVSYV